MSTEFEQAMAVQRESYLSLLGPKMVALRDAWEQVRKQPSADHIDLLHRLVHALAGSGTMFGYPEISLFASRVESAVICLAPLPPKDPASIESIQRDIETLLEIMHDASLRAGSLAAHPESHDALATEPVLERTACEALRVIVVEDDASLRDTLDLLLGVAGFSVVCVADGAALDDLLATHHPDILLLDLLLPGDQGTSLTRRVRASATYRDLPIVIMSTETSLREQVEVAGCGADAFLFKPLIPELVVATLRARACRFREQQRLEREVRDLVDRLRVTTDEALAAARVKAQFVANISHELRTPLNGIIGMSELLAETTLAPNAREAVEVIRASGAALLDLINDVLDFSKIEAGHMELARRRVALRELIDEVVMVHAQRARTKGLVLGSAFEHSVPPAIIGDPSKIRQVLNNLVSNAIKFTVHGGVLIDVAARDDIDGRVDLRVHVRDTGIGIAADQSTMLFQPFVQADGGKARQFGGTGLGLSICKRLAAAMGGDVTLESELGRGSVFTLHLKVEGLDALAADGATESLASGGTADTALERPGVVLESHAAPSEFSGKRVLVVDDNETNRLVAIRMLERLGCSVNSAEDGVRALAEVRRTTFDMILMDCQMPALDGYETTRCIRAEPGPNRGTPIIAVTAHALKEDRELCVAAGMSGYLSKPVTIQSLRSELERSAAQPPPEGVLGEPAFDPRAVASLRELDNGDDDFVDSLVESFIARSAAGLTEMRAALASEQSERAAKVAHRMKGSALNLGLLAYARLCTRLELAFRKGVDASQGALLAELDRLATQAQAFLAEESRAARHQAAGGKVS